MQFALAWNVTFKTDICLAIMFQTTRLSTFVFWADEQQRQKRETWAFRHDKIVRENYFGRHTNVLDKRFHPGDVSGLDYVVVRELMSLQMTWTIKWTQA